MARACVLLLTLTVALVPPVARLPSHVLCPGAAYDYYIQCLGCTAEEACKAERRLLPSIAESLTRTQIDCLCGWLQSSLDLSDAELKKVVTVNPTLLGYSVEAMASTFDWLQDRLGLDATQLKTMVVRHSRQMARSVKSMESNCDWMQRRLDLDAKQLKKLVMGRPSVLGYSIDAMVLRLEWLQRRLDLDDAQLKKVVLLKPALLTYSVEDNLAPTLDWLQTRLDLDESGLRKMVLALPSLLGCSVEDNLAPKLEWLRKRHHQLPQPCVVQIEALLQPLKLRLHVVLNAQAQQQRKQQNHLLQPRVA